MLSLLRRNETLKKFFANDDIRLSYDRLEEEIVSHLNFNESASSDIPEKEIIHSIDGKQCDNLSKQSTKKSRSSDKTNQENSSALFSDDDVEIISDVDAYRRFQTSTKKRKLDFDEDKNCSPDTTSSNVQNKDNRIQDTLRKPDSTLERLPSHQANTSDQERPAFDKDSFMKTRLFHLNSFLESYDGVRANPGFGPFCRSSIATPGFYNIPQYITDMIPYASYDELREAIAAIYTPMGDLRGAPQVALWLKCASIGDFVMMRHEYSNCPYLPSRLRNQNNRYIGPVYVLGVITGVVKTNSDEEEYIARNDLGEFTVESGWNFVTKFCRVDWKLMGFKANLQKSTQTYINRICQSTLNEIAKHGKVWPKLETDWESVRNDLWNNATMEISSADFNEVRYGEYQQPFNPRLAHRGNENENSALGGNNDIRTFFR